MASSGRQRTSGRQQGTGTASRDQLIVDYLPLAQRLARRYRASGEPQEDLVQIASLGLVKAAERFDPSRGNAFATFALPTIVGELNRYLRDCAWPLHVNRSAKDRARTIAGAQRAVGAVLGRQPSIQELARHLDIDIAAVADGLQAAAAASTLSLNTPINSEESDGEDWIDDLGAEDLELQLVPDVTTIFSAARHLSKRERIILYLRFSEDLPQVEIAKRVSLSQMQVSRIMRQALDRLRELAADCEAA